MYACICMRVYVCVYMYAWICMHVNLEPVPYALGFGLAASVIIIRIDLPVVHVRLPRPKVLRPLLLALSCPAQARPPSTRYTSVTPLHEPCTRQLHVSHISSPGASSGRSVHLSRESLSTFPPAPNGSQDRPFLPPPLPIGESPPLPEPVSSNTVFFSFLTNPRCCRAWSYVSRQLSLCSNIKSLPDVTNP